MNTLIQILVFLTCSSYGSGYKIEADNTSNTAATSCENIKINVGACASFNEKTGEISEDRCPYHFKFTSQLYYSNIDRKIHINVSSCSMLNNVTCGQLNRDGYLCSKCKAGYGPALYSANWMCAKCNNESSFLMWVLYLVLLLVPLTTFFFIVDIFNIHVTSPPFTAYVFYCQYFTSLFKINPYFSTIIVNHINPYVYKLVFTVIDIWSLDFFRHLVPPFCVSTSLTNTHVLFADLIFCIYPLILVLLTYILIKLHPRNTYVIVQLWKPFNKCVSRVRRACDPTSSILNTFSTFILLSVSRVSFIGIRSLYKTHKYSYYNPELKYSHLHVISVSIILIIFILLPSSLLLLYPIKVFRKILSFFCCQSLAYTQAFADTFQGYYKDGTNGSCDYRFMASSQLLLLILINFNNGWHPPGDIQMVNWMKVTTMVLVAMSVCYFAIQPYKEKCMNITEGILYSSIAVLSLFAVEKMSPFNNFHYFLYYFMMFLILLPSIILFVQFFLKRCSCHFPMKLIKCIFCVKVSVSRQIEESLPHRMVFPNDYEPLE